MKFCLILFATVSMAATHTFAADPLPSWNDTAAKQAILQFVERVSKEGSTDFVLPEDRIATFDNDGTLWCEQPIYAQLAFTFNRVKTLADKHPEWRTQQPFQAVLEDDLPALMNGGEKKLLELFMATHAGMTSTEYDRNVLDWMARARHPKIRYRYNECVYQPMLELLAYLRGQGFKTYIVSGGGVEFMRPWTEKVYGIPPEQVIGSSIKTKYELRDGQPVFVRLPEINFIDDKAGKPVGIHQFIGRKPIMAFGNSDGDYEMLEYVTTSSKPGFGLIVHHTDGEREYAYDRQSPIGRLDRALTDAPQRGWTVVDMKADWKQIFPSTK